MNEAILNKQTEKAYNVTFYVQMADDTRYKVTTWMPKSQMTNVTINDNKMSFETNEWILTAKAVEFAQWMKSNGHRDFWTRCVARAPKNSIQVVYAYPGKCDLYL